MADTNSGAPIGQVIFAPDSPIFAGSNVQTNIGFGWLPAEYSTTREESLAARETASLGFVLNNSPVYDIERFGVHFVASPRHADMLLVTGPVTRNMELALRKTYEATPEPRLVVAVGACGCSGGIFGENYATRGGVDSVIPVDVYVPGCPPNPYALLQGILLAMGRVTHRR